MRTRLGFQLPADAILDAVFGVAYAVDGDGIILGFSRGPFLDDERDGRPIPWDSDAAVGRNLFSFVDGAEVRDSFRALHAAVHAGRRQAVGFEYRCDGPEIERRMHMSLSQIRNGQAPCAVLYQSIVVSETPRVPMPLFAADTLTGRREKHSGEQIVKMCSYCQKVGLSLQGSSRELEWVDPLEYYRRGGGAEVSVSHSICKPCFERVVAPILRTKAGTEADGGQRPS